MVHYTYATNHLQIKHYGKMYKLEKRFSLLILCIKINLNSDHSNQIKAAE